MYEKDIAVIEEVEMDLTILDLFASDFVQKQLRCFVTGNEYDQITTISIVPSESLGNNLFQYSFDLDFQKQWNMDVLASTGKVKINFNADLESLGGGRVKKHTVGSIDNLVLDSIKGFGKKRPFSFSFPQNNESNAPDNTFSFEVANVGGVELLLPASEITTHLPSKKDSFFRYIYSGILKEMGISHPHLSGQDEFSYTKGGYGVSADVQAAIYSKLHSMVKLKMQSGNHRIGYSIARTGNNDLRLEMELFTSSAAFAPTYIDHLRIMQMALKPSSSPSMEPLPRATTKYFLETLGKHLECGPTDIVKKDRYFISAYRKQPQAEVMKIAQR